MFGDGGGDCEGWGFLYFGCEEKVVEVIVVVEVGVLRNLIEFMGLRSEVIGDVLRSVVGGLFV